jgi:Uma2 family endonuclease
MATVTKTKETSRYLLRGVSYATYRALSVDLENAGSRTRLTFDRGALEFMSPSYHHEHQGFLLSRLIEAIAVGLRLPLLAAESTTLTREDVDRGAEPDKCYYVANEPRLRHARDIDLADDPPPDLVIEIDVSHSSLDKLSIYAALRIPEFWRFDDGKLHILSLQPEGPYIEVESSLSFPFLTKSVVEDWVRRRELTDQTSWFIEVMTWAQAEIAPRLDRPGGVT